MPRQASPATNEAASDWSIRPLLASQYRALTWAMPTRETASKRDASAGSPVSSWMTLVISSAQASVTRFLAFSYARTASR